MNNECYMEDEDIESDSEEGSFPSYSTSIHQLCKDEENNALIRSLNKNQRSVFDVVLNWGKRFIQNIKCKVPIPLQPIRIFLTGGGGVGKSHLIKCIYNCLSKLLAYKSDELDKPRVIKLAPTGIAAINIDGTTIHTGLSLRPTGTYMSMSDKQRTFVRNKLMHVKFIIIDEISMVSPKLLLNVHRRLCEIFGVIEETPFAGKSILVCGDLYQLPPVLAKPIFSTEGNVFDSFKLWQLFKLAELDETMRQKGDTFFIDILNNVRVGRITKTDETTIKSRFIDHKSADYPREALHLFAENYSVNIHNLKMLDSLSTHSFVIPCIDKYPREFSERMINRVKEMRQTDTGGLAFELKLKIGARIMLLSNIDIDDRLINGQIGTVAHIVSRNSRVEIIYIKFDDNKAGLKAQRKDKFARYSQIVPIERTEANFSLNNKGNSLNSITRTQFPLMLSYGCTIHKVQGLTLNSAVISFDLVKQKCFNPGQMYVAMSRVKSIDGLYFIGQYRRNAFNCNKNVTEEYLRLRLKENQLIKLSDFLQSNSNLVICLLNVRSLKRHAIDIQHDEFLNKNDVLCLTETQVNSNQENEMQNINEELSQYTISYNNIKHDI